MEVYLDNAATTRLDDRVLEAMMPYLQGEYGNASSPHGLGRKARFAVEDARERIAAYLGAEPGEIVFTSGGTEANNMAIVSGSAVTGGRSVVTRKTEHESVLEPARSLAARGVDVRYIEPGDSKATIRDLASALLETTGLVSLMHTNNETGVSAPIPAIAEQCHAAGVLLHTDAVQALGWTDLQVDRLSVDMMTLSGHKIYGPKGVGVLFIRSDTVELPAFVRGGSQERRRRGGTENVAAIVGLATAVDLVALERDSRYEHLESVKRRLANNLNDVLDGTYVTNSASDGAPHILNLSFPPVDGKAIDGEMLLLNMDVAGIRVSSGSACTSGAVEPSHVLLAMGVPSATADATIRFSFGVDNTIAEMDYVAEILAEVIGRMRPVSA